MNKATTSQILAAKVRAAVEAYYKKHRKPCGGGFLLPDKKKTYSEVAKMCSVSEIAVGFCMTYSRYCEHPWSEGACSKCPPADHIPW